MMKLSTFVQAHENDEDTDYEHLEHGDDFGSPHETWISNYFGVPTSLLIIQQASRPST